MPQDASQVGAQTVPVPLVGGFYQSRSPIANDIRCVNLYPEKNAEGAPTPFTDYLTPGLTLLRAVVVWMVQSAGRHDREEPT